MVVGGWDPTKKGPGGTSALIALAVVAYHHHCGQVFIDHQPHYNSVLFRFKMIPETYLCIPSICNRAWFILIKYSLDKHYMPDLN